MSYPKSYYGSFRTRTFSNIWETFEEFESFYTTCGIPQVIKPESIRTLYYLLYARYGNSHISSSDENQFQYNVMSIIFMYGPSWEKRLEIQTKIRDLTDEELMRGGKAIYNHSFNPSTAPKTGSLEELDTINEQNTTNYKKSKMEGYSMLMSLLERDVTEEFISLFSKLFIKILAPDYPLLYDTTLEEDE